MFKDEHDDLNNPVGCGDSIGCEEIYGVGEGINEEDRI